MVMAAGAKLDSAPSSPSLQRLLSLDKSFDSLDQRIQEAARILRLPTEKIGSEQVAAASFDKSPQAVLDYAHTARHEFVIRWLLDKLKTQPAVRRSPSAWSLLYTTLERLPSPTIPKALSGAGFLSLVNQTFAALFPSGPAASAPAVLSPAPDTPSDKSSKKRKRNHGGQDKALEQAENPLEEAHCRDIFLSVAATLRLLLDRADNPAKHALDDAPVHNQIRSVLTLDSPSFASLMQHWLSALLLFAPSKKSAVVLSSGLKLITDLLSFQSALRSSDSAVSFDSLFCRHCVTPAALLLSRLHTQYNVSRPPAVSEAIQELERLLAQQLCVPARAASHAASGDRLPTTKTLSSRSQVGLNERLESFRADIANLTEESGRIEETDSKLLTAQEALPFLLDVALRCTPTSSPRQRIAEGPWIDILFSALCNALPRSASLLDDDQLSTPNKVLADMLDVMLNRKLSLSSELLVKLVNDWSDLLRWGNEALPNAGQPDFNLLSRALAMNPSIFTDSKSTRPRALFQALTIHGQLAHDDQDKIASKQGLLCRSIAIPLLKAHARIRSLSAFMDQWLLQLQKDSSWQYQYWSIWTDLHLQASLRDVLETSLTVSQIADIMEPCRLILLDLATQRSAGSKVSSAALVRASASAVILNAVVGAVHSDVATDALHAKLQSIIDTVQDLLQNARPDEMVLTTNLLAMLSRLYLLWLPVWCSSHSREEVKAKLEAVIDSPAIHESLSVVKTFADHPSKSKQVLSAQQVAADVAFALVATVCDLLRHSQDHNTVIKAMLEKTIQVSGIAASTPSSIRSTAFYTTLSTFPSLLEYLPQDDRKAIFKDILLSASEDAIISTTAAEELTSAIISIAGHAAKDELFAAIIARLDSNFGSESERIVAEKLLLLWPSKALSRQQRETIIDLAVDAVLQRDDDTPDLRPRLGLIVNLLELPSATAKIAIDSSIVWQLASALSEEEQGGLTLDLFGEICDLIFGQIVDNKEQKRSATFLTNVSESVATLMEAKQPFRSCAGQLRLLSAFVKATEDRLDKATLSKLPHRASSAIDGLVKRLYQTLSSSLEDNQDMTSTSKKDDMLIAVRLYNSLPTSFLSNGGSSSTKYTKRFTKQLDSLLGQANSKHSAVAHADDLATLSVQVQSYQHLAPTFVVEHDASRLCAIAGDLLTRGLNATQHDTVLRAFSGSASSISDAEKLSLISQLLTQKTVPLPVTAEKISLVRCIITTLQSPQTPDEAFSVGILTGLLSLLRECTEYDTHCELVNTVVSILRNKPTLVTQYGVEMTVATLIHITTPSSPSLDSKKSHAIFEGICNITRSLLQFHRPSLGGRYHVFVPLLERLVACLFTPASRDNAATGRFKHPTWINNKQHPLNISHAQRVSRLLENLCNPPQSDLSKRRQRQTAGHDLVDMTRKSRIQVGQHVQHILHYLCTLLLNGRLGEGMRDALTPGLWAIMDVTEMGTDESRGVKALSASMNNAERAILRGVFEEWRRFGSWSG